MFKAATASHLCVAGFVRTARVREIVVNVCMHAIAWKGIASCVKCWVEVELFSDRAVQFMTRNMFRGLVIPRVLAQHELKSFG